MTDIFVLIALLWIWSNSMWVCMMRNMSRDDRDTVGPKEWFVWIASGALFGWLVILLSLPLWLRDKWLEGRSKSLAVVASERNQES